MGFPVGLANEEGTAGSPADYVSSCVALNGRI